MSQWTWHIKQRLNLQISEKHKLQWVNCSQNKLQKNLWSRLKEASLKWQVRTTNYKMFTPDGTIRQTRSLRSARNKSNAQQPVARGRATIEYWGPVGVGQQLLENYAVLRTCPKIFDKVAELARRNVVITAGNPKTKRVFTPFCKGLGLFCNGFGGCGALGPHKCNQSNLSHSIKEEKIVKGRISILARASVLHILQASVLIWEERRERSGYFVRRGSEIEERETTKKCAVGALYTLYCI